MGRPTWRFSLIALALVIGWLVLVLLLMRLGGPGPAISPVWIADRSADPSSAPPTPIRCAAATGFAEPSRAPTSSATSFPPMLILMALIVVGTAIASRRQRRAATVRVCRR